MKFHVFPLFFLFVGIVYSCVNDESEVKRITDFENAPDEQSQNLKMVYSDSGLTKFHLFAEISETYTQHKHLTLLKIMYELIFLMSMV